MKNLVAVGHWLSANAFNFILAVTLAVLVWIAAEQQTNPSREAPYPRAIPIVKKNVPANMITYNETATEVRVTLSAPESMWGLLTDDRFSATIDFSGQPTGTLDLPVQVTVDNRAVRIVKIDPPIVSLKMELQTEKSLSAKVNVIGDPALGYSADAVHLHPPIITVHGPQSLVNQVAAISGQMSIQDARHTVTQTIPLSPRDETNQIVPYVTLTPSNTVATVPVTQLGGFRDMAVKIELRGNVAPGYLTTDVSVDPQVVTVFGSSVALDALPGFIPTAPISVTDATADINEQVPLVLPSGISMLGDPTVHITIKIKPIESSVNVQIPLTPQGLQPELSARLSPEALDVILSGPIARLGELQSSDVQAFVNLFNLITGTYQITPTVVIPSDIRIVSLLPSTVQVVIGPPISSTLTDTLVITGTSATPSPLIAPTPTPNR